MTTNDYSGIHSDIVTLLESARRAAARSVNALMTATYWEIGRRIVEFEQGGQDRAEYGEALLLLLATDLSARFGRGFSRRNLQQMRLFYLAWPSEQIWQTVSVKFAEQPISETVSRIFEIDQLAAAFPLPWSSCVRLLSVKNEIARRFYETEALAAAGRCASSTGRSTVSSTSARRCRVTRPRCSLFVIPAKAGIQ